MDIYDFNIHLPLLQNEDVNKVIGEDLHMNFLDLNQALKSHLPQIKENKGANFMLFNTTLFNDVNDFSSFNKNVSDNFSSFSYTALIDFRKPDVLKYVEMVKKHQVKFIMFNSYLQKITEDDFQLVYEVCKYAQDHKINICIDASYGTSKMYTYDNLKLACYIADRITKVSIIIIHSGGKRVLEAMLLAADKQNVYLDTSFSLPYYIGSSVETDMAFAYKNIGTHKVVFGSDFPYLNSENSVNIHMNFFKKFNFSDSDIEKIMCKNALTLLNNG